MRSLIVTVALLAQGLACQAHAEQLFTVTPMSLADEKAVFATVESIVIEPARTRIGGTIASLAVREGDRVEQGQVVATVADEKLALQMKSLDAQIAGLIAARPGQNRPAPGPRICLPRGTTPKPPLDQADRSRCRDQGAAIARRGACGDVREQVAQGDVLAPLAAGC